MVHHRTRLQQSLLFVEHRAQEHIGIDRTLHQYLGIALTYSSHSLGRSLFGTAAGQQPDIRAVGIYHRLQPRAQGSVESEDETGETFLKSPLYHILGMAVVRTGQSDGLALCQLA